MGQESAETHVLFFSSNNFPTLHDSHLLLLSNSQVLQIALQPSLWQRSPFFMNEGLQVSHNKLLLQVSHPKGQFMHVLVFSSAYLPLGHYFVQILPSKYVKN